MTTYDPPRPWTASYAEGVPEDLAPVTGSLVDIVEASARDYPDAARPAVLRARRRPTASCNEQIDRAAARAARPRRAARAIPSRSCCRTARSTSSRSTRSCASARSSIEHNPLYTPARAAQAVRGPRREARDRLDEGRRDRSGVPRRPRGDRPRLGRHHQGDAASAPGSRCACRSRKARESRARRCTSG